MQAEFNCIKINILALTWRSLTGDSLSLSPAEEWCNYMNLQDINRLPPAWDKLALRPVVQVPLGTQLCFLQANKS